MEAAHQEFRPLFKGLKEPTEFWFYTLKEGHLLPKNAKLERISKKELEKRITKMRGLPSSFEWTENIYIPGVPPEEQRTYPANPAIWNSLIIVYIPGFGFSLYAKEDIPEGTVLFTYASQYVSAEEMESNIQRQVYGALTEIFKEGYKICISAYEKGGFNALVSYAPALSPESLPQYLSSNLVGTPIIGTKTTRNINAGEQLLWDYYTVPDRSDTTFDNYLWSIKKLKIPHFKIFSRDGTTEDFDVLLCNTYMQHLLSNEVDFGTNEKEFMQENKKTILKNFCTRLSQLEFLKNPSDLTKMFEFLEAGDNPMEAYIKKRYQEACAGFLRALWKLILALKAAPVTSECEKLLTPSSSDTLNEVKTVDEYPETAECAKLLTPKSSHTLNEIKIVGGYPATAECAKLLWNIGNACHKMGHYENAVGYIASVQKFYEHEKDPKKQFLAGKTIAAVIERQRMIFLEWRDKEPLTFNVIRDLHIASTKRH